MPDFLYDGKVYYNPVEFALDKVGGSWKIPILWRLQFKTYRYSELKRSIPHISDKMLSSKLRDLEEDGFIHREVYPEVPPRTEYRLTDLGEQVIPIMETLRNFGIKMMEEAGIDVQHYRKD